MNDQLPDRRTPQLEMAASANMAVVAQSEFTESLDTPALEDVSLSQLSASLAMQRENSDRDSTAAISLFSRMHVAQKLNSDLRIQALIDEYQNFNPDRVNPRSFHFTEIETNRRLSRIVSELEATLRQCGYRAIRPDDFSLVMRRESHQRGTEFTIDFRIFDHCLLYYRGLTKPNERGDQQHFRRLFVLLKIKVERDLVSDLMLREQLSEAEAKRLAKRLLPPEANDALVQIKLLKDMPLNDLEFVFPNVRVGVRLRDKLFLGATGGGAIGAGVLGAAGKLAVSVSNPLVLVLTAGGLATAAAARALRLLRRQSRVSEQAAKRLSTNTLATNHTAISAVAEEALEADLKEELLVYSFLTKQTSALLDLRQLDATISEFLATSLGIEQDFDSDDALDRLQAKGVIRIDDDQKVVFEDANRWIERSVENALSSPNESTIPTRIVTPGSPVRSAGRSGDTEPGRPRHAPVGFRRIWPPAYAFYAIAVGLVVGAAALFKQSNAFSGLGIRDLFPRVLEMLGLKTSMFSFFAMWRPKGNATVMTDVVDCSVFAPADVQAGHDLLIQVFLHIPEDASRAGSMAMLMDPDSTQRATTPLIMEIERGQRISISLAVGELEVDERVQTVIWRGSPVFCQFVVHVPRAAAGKSYVPAVRLAIEGVPIGCVKYRFSVASEPVSARFLPQGQARRYQHAFLSYASQDRKEVLKRAQGLKAANISFFQDVLSLDPGARWEKEIYRNIDECDLFLLFWSKAAKESEWVVREAEYALRRQREGNLPDIIPIVLETPPPHPPPDSLSELHFNDKIHYLIDACG